MFSRLFKRAQASSDDIAWWETAERAAEHPSAATVDELRRRLGTRSADEAERQEEMLEGLDRLVVLAAETALPLLDTQHRVIGADACHLVAPATLVADVPAPGKIFLTSSRLVFAGGRVHAWPWHRLRDVMRVGRDVVAVLGGDDGVRLQCNSYGDAMVARYMARRLAPNLRPRR